MPAPPKSRASPLEPLSLPAPHLTEEEQKFFPQAGEILDDAQKLQLGRDYEAEFMTLRIKQEA